MKVPLTAISARATTGITGQRLWGEWDLNDLRADNMSTMLDVWEKELKEVHKRIKLDDIFTDDKYIKYDLLATYAHDEGVPMEAEVNLSIRGSVKELKWGKFVYRAKGPKLYTKKKDKIIKETEIE